MWLEYSTRPNRTRRDDGEKAFHYPDDPSTDRQCRRAEGGIGGVHHEALAGRFRDLLRGRTVEKLDWRSYARHCGIYAMRCFARTLRQNIEAVHNAVLEPWSNGRAEGQINRLKTLKRSMYGRAGIELLRARMPPLYESDLHRD